jgi:hypothetical protein
VVALSTAACERGPEVSIESPENGATVEGPRVEVRIEAEGVTIAPVSEQREGAAHVHLFLDTDPTSIGTTIPAGVAGITHWGGGQLEGALDSLTPGEHRLIVVLGDNAHAALGGERDTVRFVVR